MKKLFILLTIIFSCLYGYGQYDKSSYFFRSDSVSYNFDSTRLIEYRNGKVVDSEHKVTILPYDSSFVKAMEMKEEIKRQFNRGAVTSGTKYPITLEATLGNYTTEPETKIDTIPIIMLVSNTLNPYSVTWIRGYDVRESVWTCCAPPPNNGTWTTGEAIWFWDATHLYYLNHAKKKFSKSVIVWISKEQ